MNRPAIDPIGEAVPNTEFFRRLSTHMGFHEPYLQESDEDLIRTALEGDHPYLKGITFERLIEDGWAPLNLERDPRPFAAGGFPTPSGKCEFYAERLAAHGMDPLPAYEPPPESPAGDSRLSTRYPLSLLTPKSTLRFLNSSYANIPRHLKAEGEPLLEIHPDDASLRKIGDGDLVRVYNDRGSIRMRASVGTRIRPGCVVIPSGWWASLSPDGSSANALTADGLSDLGGGGNFHDTLVEVERGPATQRQ
jgi:anaerobic selenocysteine-containing dehydrogenase